MRIPIYSKALGGKPLGTIPAPPMPLGKSIQMHAWTKSIAPGVVILELEQLYMANGWVRAFVLKTDADPRMVAKLHGFVPNFLPNEVID